MKHLQSATESVDRTRPSEFQARLLDGDPALVDQSYRLRYQVYCVECGFLDAAHYPDHREIDEYDSAAIHVGAIDAYGDLAATARVVVPNPIGYPLQRYCAMFPHVRTLDEPGNVVVESSRISISRHYRATRRPRQRTEPFVTLIKAVMQAAKLAGATHMIGATDAAFHRWINHYGMPYRVAGPEVDYYGPVVPSVMSLLELDQVILSGRFRALDRYPVGWDPALWPDYLGYMGSGALLPADRTVHARREALYA